MTWFKIDDGFWSHPKTMALSAEAVALWVRAGAYSCQHLTDGHIPSRVTVLLDPSPDREQHAEELIDAGLWKSARDGYVFHDWGEYQESSDTVKKRRDQWKERQRRARESRQESPVSHANVTRDSRRESLSPVPSRPVPHSSTKSVGAKRARQLPPDWQPTEKHAEIAAERGINLDTEVVKFRDWCGATGKTYKDHDLAFNGWLRRATPDRTQSRHRDADSRDALLQAHFDMEGPPQ